ncbi:hypothetical protein KC19_1G138000 [Ceratodon purpureus]|uniref:Uncharacterized protein n=1 Tax=Ceratodon purpureus TaxID=3225 RepID=A0A8T0J4V7_CERPU|nr:hypothetical protein KC19_1G138000 [Ceratodon purpureus]
MLCYAILLIIHHGCMGLSTTRVVCIYLSINQSNSEQTPCNIP